MTVKKASAKNTDKKTPGKKDIEKMPEKKSGKATNDIRLIALKNAKTILLVDWPDKSVPMALLKAGFMVIGYSPDKYTLISYKTDYAEDKLVFSDLEYTPGEVEIVNIFRPEDEHAAIIAKHVIPLKAKAVWLHPPVTSESTRVQVSKLGLQFIQGYNIATAAQELSK